MSSEAVETRNRFSSLDSERERAPGIRHALVVSPLMSGQIPGDSRSAMDVLEMLGNCERRILLKRSTGAVN